MNGYLAVVPEKKKKRRMKKKLPGTDEDTVGTYCSIMIRGLLAELYEMRNTLISLY